MKGILALLLVGILAVGAVSAHGWKWGEDAKAAIEADDYDAWKEAAQSQMTEERFNEIVDRHEARIAMRDALSQEDYEAWREAIDALPRTPRIAEVIDEDNFDTLVDMHEAKENGDFETARELANELGLPRMGHKRGQCS